MTTLETVSYNKKGLCANVYHYGRGVNTELTKRKVVAIALCLVIVLTGTSVYAESIADSKLLASFREAFQTVKTYYADQVSVQIGSLDERYALDISNYLKSKSAKINSDLKTHLTTEQNRANKELTAYIGEIKTQLDTEINSQVAGAKQEITKSVDQMIVTEKGNIDKQFDQLIKETIKINK